jgi:hypothetical protein
VKLHRQWRGNSSRLIDCELRQHRLNEAVLRDVNRVMLSIASDAHAETDGDTPAIMHLEPLLDLILDLPTQAHGSNDKDIIDIQNDCGADYDVIHLLKEHEQSSIDM